MGRIVGSQNRAQRSQICGNKQDLINLLRSQPHPLLKVHSPARPAISQILTGAQEQVRAFISLPASAPSGLRGKARLRASTDRCPPGVADLGPQGVKTAPPQRAGQGGEGSETASLLIPLPPPRLPPPTPRPPQQPGGKFLLPPSEYKPKKAPHSISPGEIVVLPAL